MHKIVPIVNIMKIFTCSFIFKMLILITDSQNALTLKNQCKKFYDVMMVVILQESLDIGCDSELQLNLYTINHYVTTISEMLLLIITCHTFCILNNAHS